jgi:L-methionine (R)-S-oxide reductase
VNELLKRVNAAINQTADSAVILHNVLTAVLAEFKSETGTIHLLDTDKQELHLVTQIGLPAPVIEVVKLIRVGKGIAGQTVAQGKPVTICNIQKDEGGVARPGAKQTGVGGALCVPLRADGVIVGTIGVGTMREHQYTSEETELLEEVGGVLGKFTGGRRF